MATEYKLSYTASEIDEKLGKIDNMVMSVDGIAPDDNGNVSIKLKQKLSYVTPQDYGAVGDGVADDTNAFKTALLNADNVFVPEGIYKITDSIQVSQSKTIRGAGKKTVLICSSPNDFIKLNAYTTISDFTVRIESNVFNGSVFKVSSDTLAGVDFHGTANTNINIKDIDVMWDSMSSQSLYAHRAVVEISCTQAFKDYKNNSRTGFYGVKVSNVYSLSNDYCNVGYFLKGYASSNCWVTGCTLEGCVARGVRWFVFNHDTDESFENLSQTIGIDHLAAIRCQHQCGETTKGFFFLRKETNAQFTDCVPWDWHYAEGDFKNRPYWFAYDRLDNLAARVDINNGYLEGEKFGFINADNTTKLLHYYDHYVVTHNIGIHEVLNSCLPMQMNLGDDTVRATCIFRDNNPKIMGNSAYYFLRFKYVDGNYMSEDVTVYLHPTVPYVAVDRWNARHKIGYTMINGVFSVYIYSDKSKKYGYVISEPISNNTMGYSGMAMSSNYHKTINTFDLPVEERYLSSIPDEIVEITDIRAMFVTKTELENKGYLTSYSEEDPTVPAWAKVANKPTYTASEVGALPNTTKIPTKTSDLSNDSGFITSAPVASINGKTGVVTLSASDIGARPDTWMPSASDIGAVSNTKVLTMVGIDADGNTHTWNVYGEAVS